MRLDDFVALQLKLKDVVFTREDVDKYLLVEDRTLEETYCFIKAWEILAAMVKSNDGMITDDEKFILIRKPTNLCKYGEMFPHINIEGSIRTFLHYYKF